LFPGLTTRNIKFVFNKINKSYVVCFSIRINLPNLIKLKVENILCICRLAFVWCLKLYATYYDYVKYYRLKNAHTSRANWNIAKINFTNIDNVLHFDNRLIHSNIKSINKRLILLNSNLLCRKWARMRKQMVHWYFLNY